MYKTSLIVLTSALALSASSVRAANSVVVESRNFPLGQTPCTVGVSLTNDVAVSGIVMPMEARSMTGGAYFVVTGSHILFVNPGKRLDASPLGSADPGGQWPAASTVKGRYPNPQAANTCSPGPGRGYSSTAATFNGNPDGFLFATVSTGNAGAPDFHQVALQPGSDPPGRENASWLIIFSASPFSPGCFEIDTVCVTPAGHLGLINDNNNQQITPSFTMGTMCLEGEAVNQPPVLNCPIEVTEEVANGQTGGIVNYVVTVTDEDSTLVPDCNPPSGSFFMVGTTPVTCIVADTFGLADTCTFDVVVTEAPGNQPPVLHCPVIASQGVPEGSSGSIVNYSVTVSDEDPTLVPDCNPPSGSFFPLGTTPVTCTVADTFGLADTCSFIVNVVIVPNGNSVVVESRNFLLGQTPCTVGVFLSNDVPIDGLVMPMEARSTVGGAYFEVTTSHILFVNPGKRLDASPLGSTDPGGQWPAASIVKGRLPTPQAVNTCGPGPGHGYNETGASFDGNPDGFLYATVSTGNPDDPDNHLTALQPGSDPPGRQDASLLIIFKANTNPPGCFVIDSVCKTPGGHLDYVQESNNMVVRPSFTMGTICIETDPGINQPPVLNCPPLVWGFKESGQQGAVVNYTVTASDEDPTLVPTCTPPSGSFFPLGITEVTCTATDTLGLADTCSFNVHVVDADENAFVVESKVFSRGQTNCSVGVFIENIEPITGLVLPLEMRSVTNAAFYKGPIGSSFFKVHSGNRLDASPLGSADPGGAWPAASLTNSRFDIPQAFNTCTGPVSRSWSTAAASVGGTSPDAVMFATVSSGDPSIHSVSLIPGSDPPYTSGASWVFAFDVDTTPGCFEIDTCCRAPSGHISFVSEQTTLIQPNFTKGTICISNCRCDCHGNPAICSDPSINVLDVTYTLNVAFRGTPEITDPSPYCSHYATDLNCDGVTSVLDVIKMIDVAFRAANPATAFCDPCP